MSEQKVVFPTKKEVITGPTWNPKIPEIYQIEAVAKFKSKYRINLKTGCWEWQDKPANGYGRFSFPGHKDYVFAHTAAYELFVGHVPENMAVHHTCRNRMCVNPKHLKLGFLTGKRGKLNLVGQRFNRLVVINHTPGKNGNNLAVCECDCGNVVTLLTQAIKSGNTKSCGCLARDLQHGHRNSPTHISWGTARSRCRNPNSTNYPNYGGKGITFSTEWDDFKAFLRDMGERPPGTTLDRIDGNKGYEPGNCRWATPKEQRHNQPNRKQDLRNIPRNSKGQFMKCGVTK